MCPKADDNQLKLLAHPISFWDRRHGALDPWRAGGDRGLTIGENQEFYARRLGQLLELIARHTSGERGMHILDAGCGRGHLTAGLRRCGHHVCGIDSSNVAIASARDTYGGSFECAELTAHHPQKLYDIIVCMDVMFHVLDDSVWRRALQCFARYARAEAILIVTDTFGDVRFTQGDYIVHRQRSAYESELGGHDFHLSELLPYHFGSNPNQLAVFRRQL